MAIVPIGPEGQLFLVRQWRRAIQRITVELPAGTLEENEDPLHCAERELQEEIGYRANQMKPLGRFFERAGILRSNASPISRARSYPIKITR